MRLIPSLITHISLFFLNNSLLTILTEEVTINTSDTPQQLEETLHPVKRSVLLLPVVLVVSVAPSKWNKMRKYVVDVSGNKQQHNKKTKTLLHERVSCDQPINQL